MSKSRQRIIFALATPQEAREYLGRLERTNLFNGAHLHVLGDTLVGVISKRTRDWIRGYIYAKEETEAGR